MRDVLTTYLGPFNAELNERIAQGQGDSDLLAWADTWVDGLAQVIGDNLNTYRTQADTDTAVGILHSIVLLGLLQPQHDVFGLKMMYPTADPCRTWDSRHWANGNPRLVLGTNQNSQGDPDDPKGWFSSFQTQNVYIDGAGHLIPTGVGPRPYIRPPAPDPQFLNVECTAYFKWLRDPTQKSRSTGFVWGVRSGNHTGSRTQCAHAYYSRFRQWAYSASRGAPIEYAKELLHPDATFHPDESHPSIYVTGDLPRDTWIGHKFVCYTTPSNSVKLETWIDKTEGLNGGDWQKVHELEDDGNPLWTTPYPCSDTPPDAVIRVRGFCFIRNSYMPTGVSEVDGSNAHSMYKWMTVREISP